MLTGMSQPLSKDWFFKLGQSEWCTSEVLMVDLLKATKGPATLQKSSYYKCLKIHYIYIYNEYEWGAKLSVYSPFLLISPFIIFQFIASESLICHPLFPQHARPSLVPFVKPSTRHHNTTAPLKAPLQSAASGALVGDTGLKPNEDQYLRPAELDKEMNTSPLPHLKIWWIMMIMRNKYQILQCNNGIS